MGLKRSMSGLPEGLVFNNIETMQQEVIPWSELAEILKAAGYCRTNIEGGMTRVDAANWADWAANAHNYRSLFTSPITNVPGGLLAYLPHSNSPAGMTTGYIHTILTPPKNKLCTIDWLRRIYMDNLPMAKTKVKWKVKPIDDKDAKNMEVAAMLVEEGWKRFDNFEVGKAYAGINLEKIMQNVPPEIWIHLPLIP